MAHVLIVDSYTPIRMLIKDFMESMIDTSFTVSETGNGQEAWEIIENKEIDLVISGNTMPGISGLELARKVKGEDSPHKEIPFIFCSGAPGPHTDEISSLGAKSLPKPYNITQFRKMVQTLL